MEGIREFIMPELLVLIPVLYVIGTILKNTTLIADKYIPLILGILSVILCTVYITGNASVINVGTFLKSLFTGITQGILCAGASVYINQVAVVQPKNRE